jgi:hypothetical protein
MLSELEERFERWWMQEGSEPVKDKTLDCEEQIYFKCREAWMNGAYVQKYALTDESKGKKNEHK